uniref:Uncharacterized protein n=1 Tax=Knipowitschia caucasica TaxID=637954 RepID=A0AAV2K7A6_KNICA
MQSTVVCTVCSSGERTAGAVGWAETGEARSDPRHRGAAAVMAEMHGLRVTALRLCQTPKAKTRAERRGNRRESRGGRRMATQR